MRVLDGIVFFALLGYFVFRVVISVHRMDEAKIGLTQNKMKSQTVQYPSITICFDPFNDCLDSVDCRHNPTTLKRWSHEGVMNTTDMGVAVWFGGIGRTGRYSITCFFKIYTLTHNYVGTRKWYSEEVNFMARSFTIN